MNNLLPSGLVLRFFQRRLVVREKIATPNPHRERSEPTNRETNYLHNSILCYLVSPCVGAFVFFSVAIQKPRCGRNGLKKKGIANGGGSRR